jgi:cobalt-zinc-cadmium efflux system membrane fusion protein
MNIEARGRTASVRGNVTRKLAAAAIALIGAAALAGCGAKSEAPEAAATTPQLVSLTAAQMQHVQLLTVGSGSFQKAVEATAVVDFDNDRATSVLAPMSGPVARLLVEAGQPVKAGQALALVDSPDYATAVAGFRKADASAKNARRIADADKDLAQHNGLSAREAQQAETDAQNAESDRAAALKALNGLNLSPADIRAVEESRPAARMQGEIRAPVSGIVVEKLITPGQLLQAGTTASFTVADLSRMWVMAQVQPGELADIHVGDPAEVETGAGALMNGTVDNISTEVNPDTRAVLVRVAVPNPTGALKRQMYVHVRIRARQPSAGLLAPVSAVLRDEVNLPFVYVAAPGGGFARRHVTLGVRSGDRYQISEGLQPGDRIVANGALFLQFMQTQ